MMIKQLLTLGLAVMAIGAFAQTPSQGDPAKQKSPLTTESAEVREIFDFMSSRMSRQKDVWFDDGEFRRCIEVLLVEVAWVPADYDAWTSLGWMYGNIEAFHLEIAAYTRFQELFPAEPEAHYPLGEFYYRRRNYVACIGILEPTIGWEKKPHANTYRLLAHSFDRIGRFDRALAVWDEYLKLVPDDGAAKMNRQKVADKLGGA